MSGPKSHTILLVLSLLPGTVEAGTDAFGPETEARARAAAERVQDRQQPLAYRCAWDGTSVTGRFTNEAPVKKLLDMVWQSGGRVDNVVYIATPEALQDAAYFPAAQSGSPKLQSAETYLREVVLAAAERAHQPAPQFRPILLARGGLARVVQDIGHYLETGTVVDFDTTGGGRDTVALLTLILQMLEYKDVALGHVLYSHYSGQGRDNRLELQDDTFTLRQLIRAVDLFANEGRGEMLASFFEHSDVPQLRELCTAVREFSRRLTLCQVKDIRASVENVHACLAGFRTLDTRAALRDRPRELALHALMPSLTAAFVRQPDPAEGSEGQALMYLDLIDWCLERGLLQQALCIYREHVPLVLYDLRLIRCKGAPSDAAVRKRAMEAVLATLQRDRHTRGPLRGRNLNRRSPDERALCQPLFTVSTEEADIFIDNTLASLIITQQYYLRQVRNAVMHADPMLAEENLKPYAGLLAVYGLTAGIRGLAPAQLRTQMQRAVAAIRLAYRRRSAASLVRRRTGAETWQDADALLHDDPAYQATAFIRQKYSLRQKREEAAFRQAGRELFAARPRLPQWEGCHLRQEKLKTLACQLAVFLSLYSQSHSAAVDGVLDRMSLAFAGEVPSPADLGLPGEEHTWEDAIRACYGDTYTPPVLRVRYITGDDEERIKIIALQPEWHPQLPGPTPEEEDAIARTKAAGQAACESILRALEEERQRDTAEREEERLRLEIDLYEMLDR